MTDVKHWVYDLETLINCFIGVFEDYASNTQKIFVIHPLKNDIVDLMIFLKECKKNKQVWYFGYNNIGFDSQIIEHLLRNEKELLKKTPDEITSFIYSYTQSIINKSHKGEWADYPEWKLSIKQVDIYKLNHWDSDAKRTSLKWTQFGIDWDNVEEMPYHHSQNIEGWEQLKKVIKYCINDVRSTKAIFLDKDMKKQINLRSTLSKIYGINLQSASEPKISKEIFAHFLSEKLKIPKNILKNMRTFRDNIDVSTLILPYIKFSTPDFQKMYNWFSTLSFNPNTTSDEKGPNHVMLYKNVETVYALGGIHGCAKAGVYDTDDHTTIVTADVTSFYPIMAIKNKWSPSHLDRDHFSELYQWFFDERIKYDKSDPLNYLYKIILNSTYGMSKSKYSFLYDPEMTFKITVNGQLLLSMLYEMISVRIPTAIPLMQNTDGLEFKINNSDIELFNEICKEWEEMTQLNLEIDHYSKMIIRDVNNYIAVYKKAGKKPKCKGMFQWEDIPLHKNKSFLIVPKAIYHYFIDGKKPEEYITENKNIFDYCGGAKIKGNWFFVERKMKDGEYSQKKLQKLVRYYVSKGGSKLVKCNPDGREIQLEAGRWTQHVFNQYESKDNFDDYGLDEKYYLAKIYQEIEGIEDTTSKKQLTLFS